ncbi:MAG: hypothetical protein JSV62_11230 [Promethearchaeota archaeon]|nr:MAG: hypothetical protein JSV62_11230 [Candidatus Lokiarchaeota archaeon]
MKNQELGILSLSKIATYEILIEEQLERLDTVRFRFFKRYLATEKSLKRRFIISKIIGAFIFGILPIIPLLTYFQVLSFINEGIYPIELILFAGSLLFGIFFLFQFFNFFLIAMLNTMKILTGKIFEWFETLPISREKLKKLIYLTIIRSLDIPLIIITICFPLIMYIGTQNLFIFFICIGVSIVNTIFSFSVLIIFSERMNRILNINERDSKRTYLIRLTNLIIYIIIVIGSVFLIQWALSSIETFFLLFATSTIPAIIVLILSMIPFPIAPGYMISSFIAPNRIPFQIWYNIIIGFILFLIITLLIYWKSVAGILKKATYSKFKNKNYFSAQHLKEMKDSFKIKINSPFWAYIRKDLIISTRNLKHFLSVVMPIIIGFIFTFTYNITVMGGIIPPEIEFLLNLFVTIGFNIVIAGMIVYGLLNIEESGASILGSLPMHPREQAKSKLIFMIFIQTITVLAPSLMYIGSIEFISSITTTFLALPFVLLFLFMIFEMRIYFFGKAKHFYIIEEAFPEKKLVKWLLIFAIDYGIYFFIISLSFTFYGFLGLSLLVTFLMILLLIGFIFVIIIFGKVFPKEKIEVEPKEGDFKSGIVRISIMSAQHYVMLLIIILGVNFGITYLTTFIQFPELLYSFNWINKTVFLIIFLIACTGINILLWILTLIILGVPWERLSPMKSMRKIVLGDKKSMLKKITISIIITSLILFLNYLGLVDFFLREIPSEIYITYIYNIVISFSILFWEEFGFRGVLLNFSLKKLNIWKAIILNALLYSFYNFVFLFLSSSFMVNVLPAMLLETLYIFLIGLLFAFIYTEIENLIILSSISLTFNVLIRVLFYIYIILPIIS